MSIKVNNLGVSDDFRTFYCSLNDKNPRDIKFSVINTYFGFEEYKNSLTLTPGINYWNYVVTNHQHRYVEFFDTETNEFLGQFTLPGSTNYFDYDKNQYSKKIFQVLPDSEKSALINVMNEIVCQNTYSNDFVCVEKNDIVVDIGFNYGLFTISSLEKNPKRIIGFEPNNKLCEIFNKNFNDDRVTLVNCAVSDNDKVARFYENNFSVMNTIKENSINDSYNFSYEVQVLGINNIIKNYNLDKIDYLKVDCEGSEYEIFESISISYLTNNVRKIAVEFHNKADDVKVLKLLNKILVCGFEVQQSYYGGDVGMIYAKKRN